MAGFCIQCGAPIENGMKFCTECGTPVEMPAQQVNIEEQVGDVADNAQQEPDPQPQVQPTPQPTPQPIPQPTPQPIPQPVPAPMPVPQAQPQNTYSNEIIPQKGSKYEPISTGGYIGIMFLMCIPVVGLILMIVWACGGCRKVNKTNLARASLIMMAVGTVISLIIGLIAGGLIKSALRESGLDTGRSGGGITALIGAADDSSDGSEESGFFKDTDNVVETEDTASVSGEQSETAEVMQALEALTALAGLAENSGDGSSSSSGSNSDLEQLAELSEVLGALEGLTGGDGSVDALAGLVDNVEAINQDAEAANDGWPESLRPYPGGTSKAVASYRTEISSTTKEEMLAYIEDLKKDGFAFQDFYEFGLSEQDMLNMDGWWATDGNIYLSISYYDGTVTVDHTYELPDIASYFE